MLSADIIPKTIPVNIAIKIAENAKTNVFGSVSEIILDTFLPWLTKEVLKYGYFRLTENSVKPTSSIPE